ncbi:phosphotransferase family protein (plasmid) [Streptomyces sp. BI20]|uniref:phosphotransferase family protein n=1 Tax=Streptomyces sp. BI20 TaxID=3403460 RepID=UPI003C722975
MTAPTPAVTSLRPAWDDLPQAVRDAITDHAGAPVAGATTQTAGFSNGLAVRLVLADGRRLFVKGTPTDHVLHPRYAEEAAIGSVLTGRAPVPDLLRTWEVGGWLLMVIEDVDGRHPDIRPDPDGPGTDTLLLLDLLAVLPRAVTPSPLPDAPDFVDVVGEEFHGWARLRKDRVDIDPWAARHLDALAGIEREWTKWAQGTTLVHADLRPDNILLTPTRSYVLDWAYLHQGAPWIDPAVLFPHLLRAGHTAPAAEALMNEHVPTWRETPPEVLTSFAAAFTGYWERACRLPAPPGVPYLRPFQKEMAGHGRRWIAHRTGWE